MNAGIYGQGGGGTLIYIADWLGTHRAAISYTGAGYSSSGAHAPFGEAYDYPNGYPGQFTGQQDDGGMTNTTHFFPERFYRSSQGRWASPDPAGMGAVDASDPQSWNRYAYVRNSPLTRTDPQGLDDWGDDWGGGWGGGDWGGWGGDSGGWFGTINISWGGGGVNVGFSGFGGGCSGESLGVPCGGSLNDPYAKDVALARQMIIAAVKGDWKGVLGLYAGALSQDLWSMVPDPMIMDANNGLPCLAGAGPLQVGQSRCAAKRSWLQTHVTLYKVQGCFTVWPPLGFDAAPTSFCSASKDCRGKSGAGPESVNAQLEGAVGNPEYILRSETDLWGHQIPFIGVNYFVSGGNVDCE